MTFFTGLGIFIVVLFGYIVLFGVGLAITGESKLGALFVGILLSILFAIFVCIPESCGYQKIIVSENAVEVSE